MPQRIEMLAAHLAALDREAVGIGSTTAVAAAVQRWHADCLAALFHLRDRGERRLLIAVLGGTGTGKSTIVNRLLGAEVSATSLRRTFTSGPIAVARASPEVPEGWLGLPRKVAGGELARGELGMLTIVEVDRPVSAAVTIVDTPDLDGDQPLHQAEADRAFRWADGVVFLVTPEKYQMTELLPYYRLAKRYGLAAMFVMNKCEEAAVLEDYRRQLAARDWPDAAVFAVPRDDAAYEPEPDNSLERLRQSLTELPAVMQNRKTEVWRGAMTNRLVDLLGRFHDQVLDPMRRQRSEVDRLCQSLNAMASPAPGVDVSLITQQLQRRLQEQSVLYLMGPQRLLQRVRQVPALLAKLPRVAWDMLVRGKVTGLEEPNTPSAATDVPDFPKILADQFVILQSRIEDVLLSSGSAAGWMKAPGASYQQVKQASAEAGKIAEEELNELKAWLEQRWHAAPRDTAIMMKLLRLLPGGKKLAKWSEAAPYLLTIIVASTGALFGRIDLLILGSYSLATWLGEKLSNEVTWRARRTNRRIAERFAKLSQEQIDRVCDWLERQAPSGADIRKLERMAESVANLTSESFA